MATLNHQLFLYISGSKHAKSLKYEQLKLESKVNNKKDAYFIISKSFQNFKFPALVRVGIAPLSKKNWLLIHFEANQIIFSQSSAYQCNLHSDVPVLLGSFFVEPTVGPVYGSRIRPQYAFNEEAIIH